MCNLTILVTTRRWISRRTAQMRPGLPSLCVRRQSVLWMILTNTHFLFTSHFRQWYNVLRVTFSTSKEHNEPTLTKQKQHPCLELNKCGLAPSLFLSLFFHEWFHWFILHLGAWLNRQHAWQSSCSTRFDQFHLVQMDFMDYSYWTQD